MICICCWVAIQSLDPSKDPAFEVFEGESFGETLLTASIVVKWDGLAFGTLPGCVTRCFTLTSQFLPPRPVKVTIYATWCRHFLSFFLLFRARKESWDMWSHPPKRGKRRPHLWAAFGGAFGLGQPLRGVVTNLPSNVAYVLGENEVNIGGGWCIHQTWAGLIWDCSFKSDISIHSICIWDFQGSLWGWPLYTMIMNEIQQWKNTNHISWNE